MPISQLAPIGHPVLDTFLLGFICASSLVASLYFLRFRGQTRDPLFLAFAVFFATEGLNEAYSASLRDPNIGSPGMALLRLLAVLGVIVAIVWKNLR